MRKIYILITLLFVFFVSIAIGLINFKNDKKKNYSFLGMFPFELKSDNNSIFNLIFRIVLALSIGLMSGDSLYLLVFNESSVFLTKSLGILIIFTSIILISIFIINFRSFNAHILASSIFLTFVLLDYSLFGYIALINYNECFYLYQAIIAFVLALIIALIMVYPPLSSWDRMKKKVVKDEISYERKRINILSLLEWLGIFLFLFLFVLITLSKIY